MDSDYEKMLDEAMGKMPQKSESVSRFKMPQIASASQGSKTIIQNFIDIANTLRRDPKHVSKYLLKETAMAGVMQGNQLVLNGGVKQEDLQRRLEGYSNEFVFCKSCKNPDTRIVTEGKIDYLVCEACGSKNAVRSLR